MHFSFATGPSDTRWVPGIRVCRIDRINQVDRTGAAARSESRGNFLKSLVVLVSGFDQHRLALG
jgi:hypothetical protein